MEWISVEETMPLEAEDFGDFTHSEPVLVWRPKFQEVTLCYFERWKNEDEAMWDCWKLAGRDGYVVGGVDQPTHWMPLPEGPK